MFKNFNRRPKPVIQLTERQLALHELERAKAAAVEFRPLTFIR